MSDDFEARLRAALKAEAASVTPDPQTWRTVRDRRTRRSNVAWLGLAVATAAVAVFVAVNPEPLLEARDRVGFGPADEAVGPEVAPPEPAPTVGDDAGAVVPLVASTGEALFVASPDGVRPLEGIPAGQVAVRPGSSPERGVLAVRPTGTCALFSVVWDADTARVVEQYGPEGGPQPDACPGRPVFAPDGDLLVRVEDDGDGPLLLVDPVDADGEVDEPERTTVTLDGDAGELGAVDFDYTSSGAGTVLLSDGRRAAALPVVRVDGGLSAATAGGGPADVGALVDVAGQANAAEGGLRSVVDDRSDVFATGGATYAVAVTEPEPGAEPQAVDPEPGAEAEAEAEAEAATPGAGSGAGSGSDGVAQLLRDADDGQASVELPAPVAAADEPWLHADQDVAVVGDGTGGAWVVRWTGDELTEPAALDGTILDADVIRPPPPPPRVDIRGGPGLDDPGLDDDGLDGDGLEDPGLGDPGLGDPGLDDPGQGGAESGDAGDAVSTQPGEVFLSPAGAATCDATVAVPRMLAAERPAFAAVNQLLVGATVDEQDAFVSPFTAGSTGNALASLNLTGSRLTVDFDDTIVAAAAPGPDGCGPQRAVAQLTATMTQFATVDDVRLTIDGSQERFAEAFGDAGPAGGAG